MKKATKNDYVTKSTAQQCSFVLGNGIKIYPVHDSLLKQWFVEVDNNGNIKKFDKSIKKAEINEAIDKTIQFYYKKLKELENAK